MLSDGTPFDGEKKIWSMAELSRSEEAEDAENGELIKFNITFLEPHQDHQQHKKRKNSNPIPSSLSSAEKETQLTSTGIAS